MITITSVVGDVTIVLLEGVVTVDDMKAKLDEIPDQSYVLLRVPHNTVVREIRELLESQNGIVNVVVRRY